MRLTERARLAAVHGGLLLLAGISLVTVIYLFTRMGLEPRVSEALPAPERGVTLVPADAVGGPAQTVTASIVTDVTITRLLVISGTTLAVFAVAAVLVAWWLAGRLLHPVAAITAAARRLSGQNLHQRIALPGPPGELKKLADTFDEMLDRIERLVGAQRRFAANAAHELRTMVAVQRSAAEIGLLTADQEQISLVRAKLLDVAREGEQLIESLILLAATDQGLERRERIQLPDIVRAAAGQLRRPVTVGTLDSVEVHGDPVLLTRLVYNLLENGLRHNHTDGVVEVSLRQRQLRVVNTGPAVPAENIPRLFEPFHRERTHHPGKGAGLGLSIVASIADAHGMHVTATPNPEGGLTVMVNIP